MLNNQASDQQENTEEEQAQTAGFAQPAAAVPEQEIERDPLRIVVTKGPKKESNVPEYGANMDAPAAARRAGFAPTAPVPEEQPAPAELPVAEQTQMAETAPLTPPLAGGVSTPPPVPATEKQEPVKPLETPLNTLPSPFDLSPEAAAKVRELAAYQPTNPRFLTPDPELEKLRLKTEFQEDSIRVAPVFYTASGEEIPFKPNHDVGQRMQYMIQNGGVEYPKIDVMSIDPNDPMSGTSKVTGVDAEGKPIYDTQMFSLIEEGARYKFPDKKTGLAGVVENLTGFTGQALFGPSESQMASTVKRLEEAGVTDAYQQAIIARNIRNGEYAFHGTVDGPLNILSLVGSVLVNAPGAVIEALASGSAAKYEDVVKEVAGEEEVSAMMAAPEKLRETIEVPAKYIAKEVFGAEGLGFRSYAEAIAGDALQVDVVEEALSPVSWAGTLADFAIEDAMIYLPWYAARVMTVTKDAKKLDEFAEFFGADNFADALRVAATRENPMSPQQAMEHFILSKYGNAISREVLDKHLRRLEDAVHWKVRQPGTAIREEYVRPQLDSLRSRLEQNALDIKAASKAGNQKSVDKLRVTRAMLEKEARELEEEVLTPKWVKDMKKEYGVGTTSVATTHYILQEHFGATQESLPFTAAAAGIFSVLQIRNADGTMKWDNPTKIMRGVKWTGTTIKNILKAIPMGPAERAEFAKQNKLNAEAMKALQEIEDLGPAGQYMMNGLYNAASVRDDLIRLSTQTGVDIDPDLYVHSLAQLIGISHLRDQAAQLRNRTTVTSLSDLAGSAMEQDKLLIQQRMLLTGLAEAAQRLTELRTVSGVSDSHVISQLSKTLTNAVATEKKYMQNAKESIKQMNDNIDEGLAVLTRSVDANVEDGGYESLQEFQMLMESQLDNLMDDPTLRQTVKDMFEANPDVQRLLEAGRITGKDIDAVLDKQLKLLEQASKGRTSVESVSGVASNNFAQITAAKLNQVKAQGKKMFDDWAEANADVQTNIAPFFDRYMDSPGSFLNNLEVPDDASALVEAERLRGQTKVMPEILRMAGYKEKGGLRRDAAAMFNGAARRSIDILKQGMPEDQAAAVDELLGAGNELQQWMALRGQLNDPSPEFIEALGLENTADVREMLRANAENLPLNLTAQEWRLVSKSLGNAAYNTKDEAAAKLMREMHRAWNDAGNPDSGMAFFRMEGDEPIIVAEDVYGQMREAQDFWRAEVLERYTKDPVLRKWYGAINGNTGQIAEAGVTFENIEQEAFLRAMSESSDRDVQPFYWLDSIVKELYGSKDVLEGENIGQPLYMALTDRLGRSAGVYDKNTGTYRMIFASDNEADALSVRDAEQARKALLDHVRGYLLRTSDAGKLVQKRDMDGNIIFEPLEGMRYDENVVRSLLNMRKRQRVNGEIVDMLDENGQPVPLFTEEEIYSAINLDALYRNRKDLQGTFKEAENITAGFRKEAEGIVKDARIELETQTKILEKVQMAFYGAYGQKADRTIPLSEDVGQRVYNAIISGEGLTAIEDAKALVRQMGIPNGEKMFDDTVNRAVNAHIRAQIKQQVGVYTTTLESGVVLKDVPEIGVSPTKIWDIIGESGSEKRQRLTAILGEDAVEGLDITANIVSNILRRETSGGGAAVRRTALSLDSILSRIYNIQRGVVSPQWVATESIIRASRAANGAMVDAMMSDVDLAREVMRIIESGEAPSPAFNTQLSRALSAQLVDQQQLVDYIIEGYQEVEQMQQDNQDFMQYSPYGGTGQAPVSGEDIQAKIDYEREKEAEKQQRMDAMPYETRKREGMGFATPISQ